MKALEAKGFEVTYLQPDEAGFVSADTLKAALRPDTILVSIMMVNNESGAVMPIADMIRITRRLSPLALFHTDAVQGFLKIPFKAKTLGADLISVSGHKIHGPKGVGALYIRPGLPLPPFIHGGGQESNFRSGTENLPGICGFAAACAATDAQQEIARMTDLRDYCRARAPGNSGARPHRAAGSAAHCKPFASRSSFAGHHQLPADKRHLRLRRLRLLQGAPQPRAGGDAPSPRRHRRLCAHFVLRR